MIVLDLDRKEIEIKEKDGEIISVKYFGGPTENLRKAVNIKEWLETMSDLFLNNNVVKFHDMLGTSQEKKAGKFFEYGAPRGVHVEPEDLMTRQPNMFEKRYWHVQSNSGTRELEIEWAARAPLNKGHLGYSGYGWVEIKIDVQVRDIREKEVLINNKKVILLEGKYEFRNAFVYKNNIIPEVLNKMPIVKNSEMLKEMVLKYFFLKDIERDIEIAKEVIKPLVYDHLRKHFA